MSQKNRIEFIDLAKGICIFLVVLGHVVPTFNISFPAIECLRMPLYYCLSGLFFKDYGGLKALTLRKTNKILIPFIAWYLIGYAVYYAGNLISSYKVEHQFSIYDIFLSRSLFNLPIWFLLSLFWSNLLFYIASFPKSHIATISIIVSYTVVGWCMMTFNIPNFLYFATTLSCMPFFYLGYLLKRTSLLLPSANNKKNLIFLIFCAIAGSLIAFLPEVPPRIQYATGRIVYGNPLQIYGCAAFFVIALLLLCRFIRRVPFISWIGQYSIIVLVTHRLICAIFAVPLHHALGNTLEEETLNIIKFLLVILSMLAIIPLCRKYLPHITAQKDIL